MTRWLLRRRRMACQFAPGEGAPPVPSDRSIYRDGTYLISSWGEARTWAVCDRGRWGVVYEWLGEQPVRGWVIADMIPLEVRARALRGAGERQR
jgi:hypothetical protein